MDISLLRKWIVEFIGTFFLVYVIGCVSLQDHVLLGPLAIGASLMVMIFAGGHISGGHYNPSSAASYNYKISYFHEIPPILKCRQVFQTR